MNKKIIITIISLIAIISIALVSAIVVQENFVYYGVIESNGSLTTTTSPVTNVSAVGFVCSSANCSTVSGTLWNGQVLNSGNTSKIDLTYPTLLQGVGYGLFFYKEGYIPYEVFATWSGSGEAPAGSRYLTRKQTCSANITGYNVSYSNGNLIVNVNINAPIYHAGPLNYVPNTLASFYDVNVQARVNITGTGNYLGVQNLTINYSEQKTAVFQFAVGSGNYNITISSLPNDAQCLNAVQTIRTSNFSVIDSIPPAAVSSLVMVSKSSNHIHWSWTNPSDADFSQALIYLNGVNVVNTTASFYNATGLLANTAYTITINTRDISGNVNSTNVINTQTTDNIPGGGGGSSGISSDNKKKKEKETAKEKNLVESEEEIVKSGSEEITEAISLKIEKEVAKGSPLFLYALALLCLVILIIVIIVGLLRK